jgi:Fe-S-cluster containining protein
MKFHFPDGQHYDCVQCAKGCRSPWRIRIDHSSEAKIYGSPLDRRLREQHQAPTLITEADGTVLPARHEGACVFLNGNLCSVHAEMGVEAKPLGCRQFPFLYQPTPDGIFVGVSFYCTAVQENTGRLLADHQPELEPIVANLSLEMIGENPIRITPEISTDWSGYKTLEAHLTSMISSFGCEMGVAESLWRLYRIAFHTKEGSLNQSDFSSMLDPWQDPRLNGSIMQTQHKFYLAALVALIEVAEPKERKEFTNALLSGAPCTFDRFSWTGTMDEINRCCDQLVRDRFDLEIERYIRALIHRKFLAARRTVLVNLTIVHLLPVILKFYAALSTLSRKASQSEPTDFFRSLDIAEIDLITHVKGLDRLLAILSAGYLQQVNAILRDPFEGSD